MIPLLGMLGLEILSTSFSAVPSLFGKIAIQVASYIKTWVMEML